MTEGTIEDFCTITDRNVEKYSIYIEFEGSDIEFDTKLDVIFMNKVVPYLIVISIKLSLYYNVVKLLFRLS